MFKNWSKFLTIGGALLTLAGCAPGPEAASGPLLSGSCTIPSDQFGSFMGRVLGYPKTLTADEKFSDEERALIAHSVLQWNELGREVLGTDLFNLRYAAVPSAIALGDPTDCTNYFQADASGGLYLVRETSANHWSSDTGLNLSSSIPGATFRCEENFIAVNQIVFVYPELAHPSQFSSIVVHELGHVVGLDHSCQPNGDPDRTDYATCTGLASNHPYRTAAMYPWLRWNPSGEPEVKDFLRSNDRQRGQCIIGN